MPTNFLLQMSYVPSQLWNKSVKTLVLSFGEKCTKYHHHQNDKCFEIFKKKWEIGYQKQTEIFHGISFFKIIVYLQKGSKYNLIVFIFTSNLQQQF